MKVKVRDKENMYHEFDTDLLKIVDKDGMSYRINQDFKKGIEILSDGLSPKILVEPRCANVITVIGIEE